MQQLINPIIKNFSQDIISLILTGSQRGLSDPKHSDIDFLLLTKDKRCWGKISQFVRSLEKEVFGIKHSWLTNFLEKNFLGSNDLRGVHLMLFSREDFGKNFAPKSLRLKLITALFISQPIFMALTKENYRVLFGSDVPSQFKLTDVYFKDRLLTITLPCFILLILPVIYFDKNNFKMWCLKAAKYHLESLEGYLKIRYGKPLDKFKSPRFDDRIKNWIKNYRYQPEKWQANLLGIYFFVWKTILGNIPFIVWGAVVKIK